MRDLCVLNVFSFIYLHLLRSENADCCLKIFVTIARKRSGGRINVWLP